MSQTVIPQLRMTDAKRSQAFYLDQLGFTVDWQHQFEPGLPLFLQITREGQTIFLTGHAGDCKVGGAVYFWVPDADACYAAFTAQGVKPVKPIADTDYGVREFLIADPDGNTLRFGTRLGGQAA
jgi:catechol 2,3-dioxygenase-like lactoylglutathione lyase family enzyme